ncbi:MAG: sigma-70 family RNA polymerase sigma factor, partial [Bacteroidota bacterium]
MAEDFTQELFTKIIRKPELFKLELSFSTWVFSVATNMCKNAYRKRAYEQAYLDQLPINPVENRYAEQFIDQQIKMDELHKILEKLGEEKREIFLLRYQQELSVKEIAATIDCTEGTVKSRLFYIRKNILELFEEFLITDQQ